MKITRLKIFILIIGWFLIGFVAGGAYGQTMPHDPIDIIMAQSNPACYVRGEIDRDHYMQQDNDVKYVNVKEIEPQYYAWADVCEQLFGLHYTEFEVDLDSYVKGDSITITFILDNDNWMLYNVSKMVTGI